MAFKLLFVDNSRTTREAMARILKTAGYPTETAGSGAEAIELVKKTDYSLVVMDLYMPSMNGYEAAKVIRGFEEELKKNVPIIALTASNDVKDLEISKNSGMNEFVTKTQDNFELMQVLARYMEAFQQAHPSTAAGPAVESAVVVLAPPSPTKPDAI